MPPLLHFPLRKPALFFGLWALWLSLEYWGLGPFSYLFIHDNADQAIPFMSWVTRSVQALLHDPLVPVVGGLDRFSGTAWLVAHQAFYLKCPLWLGHGLFIAFQRFLCGYFTFRFMRDALKVRPGIACLAGLAYTLIHAENGELRLMHVFNEPGFPALLWGFCCIPAAPFRRAASRYLLLSLLIGLGMGPVDAMPFFIPVAFITALLLRDDTRTFGGFLGFTTWVFVACALALPWKIPGLQALLANAAYSHRATWDAGLGWQDSLLQLVTGRIPWLAGWWLVLLFALPWLLPFWRWRRRIDLAILWLLFVGLVLGPLTQTAAFVCGDSLGVLRGVNWFRFDRTAPLALLAAGAMGLHRWFEASLARAKRKNSENETLFTVPNIVAIFHQWEAAAARTTVPTQAAVLTLLSGLIAHESWTVKEAHFTAIQAGHNWRALFQNAEVETLAKDLSGKPVRVATPGAFHEFHPMFNLAYGLECADGYAVLYPDRYHRFWMEVLRPLMTREPYFKGHFEGWGSRVSLFHSQDPANAALTALPLAEWYNLDLLSLANVQYLVSKKPVQDARLKLVPQIWSEEKRDAWAAKPLREKLADYRNGTNPGPRAYVYENPDALPRCFFAPGCRVFETSDDLFATLGKSPVPELTREVFLLKSDVPEGVPANPPEAPQASVLSEKYLPADFTVATDSSAPGWLVCTQTWYPWWVCEIDGKPAPIVPAYGTFLATRLPAGRHEVRWVYRPPYAP